MMKKIAVVLVLFAIYIGYLSIDNFDPELVKGKNVIITGASTGVGEQLAYQYARLGANIVVTARREQRLKEVVEKCKQIGNKDGRYHYIALDMGHKDATKQLIEFAENKLKGIDALVLNHAIYYFALFHGTPENITSIYEIMNVNFLAYVSAATYALPALKRSKGSIILLDSPGATEHIKQMVKEKDIEWMLDQTNPQDPSETALAIVKAGTQRLPRMYFPWYETRPFEIFCNIIPGTMGFMYRKMFEVLA